MHKKNFFILFILVFNISFSQKVSRIYEGRSEKNTRPNVLLKLKDDNTYDLQIFNTNSSTWKFYNGKYQFQKDTLILEYKKFYAAPVCQLTDTFHHRRTINLIYTDADNKAVDTFSIEFNRNSFNSDYFPLTYRDTVERASEKDNRRFIYYVPDFEGDEMNILFYKPEIKTNESFLITFLADNNYLMVDEKFKSFFAPYDKLKLQ